MKWFALAALLCAGPAFAQDWHAVTQDSLHAALAGRTVVYANARQDFRASGKTLYTAGEPSWGNWEARADGQYCSQWPPGRGWDCYDVELRADGARIRFIGASGDVTEGAFVAE